MKLKKMNQGYLEDYEEYLLENSDGIKGSARYSRLIIESAVESGFAVDMPDDLRKCAVDEVMDITKRILEHVKKAKAGAIVTGE